MNSIWHQYQNSHYYLHSVIIITIPMYSISEKHWTISCIPKTLAHTDLLLIIYYYIFTIFIYVSMTWQWILNLLLGLEHCCTSTIIHCVVERQSGRYWAFVQVWNARMLWVCWLLYIDWYLYTLANVESSESNQLEWQPCALGQILCIQYLSACPAFYTLLRCYWIVCKFLEFSFLSTYGTASSLGSTAVNRYNLICITVIITTKNKTFN